MATQETDQKSGEWTAFDMHYAMHGSTDYSASRKLVTETEKICDDDVGLIVHPKSDSDMDYDPLSDTKKLRQKYQSIQSVLKNFPGRIRQFHTDPEYDMAFLSVVYLDGAYYGDAVFVRRE